MTHAFANIVGTSAIEDVTAKMPISTWAEGAMFASVDDAAAFQAGLFGGQLLAPKWVAEMQKVAPNSQGYGLGIYSSRRNGRKWWGHTGRTLGFESIAWHDPSTGAAIVLIQNASWCPNAKQVNAAWYAVEREANTWIK